MEVDRKEKVITGMMHQKRAMMHQKEEVILNLQKKKNENVSKRFVK